MTEVGLERADRHVSATGKNARHAPQFGGITNRRTGGVAFEQADVGRLQAGLFVGKAQCAFLAFFRGGKQTAPTPVIGQTNPANHAQHLAPVGQGVGEAFEDDKAGAFGWHQTIGIAVEGATLAGFA